MIRKYIIALNDELRGFDRDVEMLEMKYDAEELPNYSNNCNTSTCNVCHQIIKHIGYIEGVSKTPNGDVFETDIHICDYCYGKLCDLIQEENQNE